MVTEEILQLRSKLEEAGTKFNLHANHIVDNNLNIDFIVARTSDRDVEAILINFAPLIGVKLIKHTGIGNYSRFS
jgi:hypothetical protein